MAEPEYYELKLRLSLGLIAALRDELGVEKMVGAIMPDSPKTAIALHLIRTVEKQAPTLDLYLPTEKT